MKHFLKKKEILFLLLVVSLLIFLNLFEQKTKNVLYSLSEPLQKFLSKVGKKITNFFEIISKIGKLEKENKALLAENWQLKSQIVALKELERENEVLRKALNLNLQEDFQLLLSQVVSKDSFEDSILIDKGKNDGLLEGQVVITPQKTLVGRIEKVYDDFSKVMLITNKNASFPAKIQTEKEVSGIVRGRGNFELFFDLIPQEAEIQKGQKIATISLGGNFPKGLFVGEVETVEKSDLFPYQKAKIKPAFDLKNLETLFVILNF